MIETVGDKRVFTDGTRRVEIHNIKGLPHADGMLIAYMPSARIVAYADMFNLAAPGATARAESARRRHAGVRREPGAARDLDWENIISVHAPNPDRPITRRDILASLGR